MEFNQRSALVTGAATGIGEQIARRLFAGGAAVTLVGHDGAALERLRGELDPEWAAVPLALSTIDGRPALVGVMIDVTERRRTEAAEKLLGIKLPERLEYLRVIFAEAPMEEVGRPGDGGGGARRGGLR